MTDTQLYTILAWKYPDIGKSYYVKDGVLVFQLWIDRATGNSSAVTQPTLEQCESWAAELPTFQGQPVISASQVDTITASRIRALIGGVDPIQEQLKGLRQVAWAQQVKANPGDFSQADQAAAVAIISASLALNTQIETIRADGKAFKLAQGW